MYKKRSCAFFYEEIQKGKKKKDVRKIDFKTFELWIGFYVALLVLLITLFST